MSNQSFDVTVGKDAEKRWKTIHERQSSRNKLRKDFYGEEKGVVRALRATGTGKTDYEPLKGADVRAVEVPDEAMKKV
jgi:hypothetical protein